MAFPTAVNNQITDSISQVNTKVLGDAPAVVTGNFMFVTNQQGNTIMSEPIEHTVNSEDQQVTQAVEYTDTLVAEQSADLSTNTPEQAEQVATNAVINAINASAEQFQGEAE